MSKVYLVLVVLGAAIPSVFTTLYCFEQVNEWGSFGVYEAFMLSPFFYKTALLNHVSTQLLVDVLITTVVFFLWAYPEAKRLGMKHFWMYPLITYMIAFSFAFPLFLYFREKALQESYTAEPAI